VWILTWGALLDREEVDGLMSYGEKVLWPEDKTRFNTSKFLISKGERTLRDWCS